MNFANDGCSTRSKKCHVEYVIHNFVFCTLCSRAIDRELRDASVLILCILTDVPEFVDYVVKILTAVGQIGNSKLKFMAHFFWMSFRHSLRDK